MLCTYSMSSLSCSFVHIHRCLFTHINSWMCVHDLCTKCTVDRWGPLVHIRFCHFLLDKNVSKSCIHLIWVLTSGHLSLFRELVDSLHQRNIKVFLISGGFRCIVEHVATQLNIPLHHVYANRLRFYFNGKSWRQCVSETNLFLHLKFM